MKTNCLYYTSGGNLIVFDNYEIDDNGKLYNKKRGTVLKECVNETNGRPFYFIRQNGKPYNCFTNRLVYSSFVGFISPNDIVINVDGDLTNNSVNNLSLGSTSDTCSDLDNYISSHGDMYSAHKFDLDTARIFGVSPTTVYNHRKHLGIGWSKENSCQYKRSMDLKYYKIQSDQSINQELVRNWNTKNHIVNIAMMSTRITTNPYDVASSYGVSSDYVNKIFRKVHNIMYYVYELNKGVFDARKLYILYGLDPDILDTMEEVLHVYGGITPSMVTHEDLIDQNKSFGNEMFCKRYK